MGPDLAGFRDAQVRLIDETGLDADFSIPASGAVYPSGTAIDPETQKPHDPTIAPTNSQAPTIVTVKANAVRGGVTPQREQSEVGPLGRMDDNRVVVRVKPDDYPRVQDATTVTIYGEVYRVKSARPSGLDQPSGWLIYGEKR